MLVKTLFIERYDFVRVASIRALVLGLLYFVSGAKVNKWVASYRNA